MTVIELNVDIVPKSIRNTLVMAASGKSGKGYYLNVRMHLNQFKITAIDLKK